MRTAAKKKSQKQVKSPSLFFETGEKSLPVNLLNFSPSDLNIRNSMQVHNLLSKSEGFDLLESKQKMVCSEKQLLSPG